MKELRDERAETGEKMRDLEAYIGHRKHRRRRYVPVELGEQGQGRKTDGTGPLAEAKAQSPCLTPFY